MTWLMFGKNLGLWLRQTDVDSLDINCGKAGGYHNFFPENVLLCCNKVSLPRLGLSEIQVIIHETAKCQEPVNGAKCLNGRTMLSFSDEDSLQKAFIKTLTLRGWEKTAQSPFTVRPVYFQCKMVYTQHVKRFELLTFTVWLCIKRSPLRKVKAKMFSCPHDHGPILCLLLGDLRIRPLKPLRQTPGLVTHWEEAEMKHRSPPQPARLCLSRFV